MKQLKTWKIDDFSEPKNLIKVLSESIPKKDYPYQIKWDKGDSFSLTKGKKKVLELDFGKKKKGTIVLSIEKDPLVSQIEQVFLKENKVDLTKDVPGTVFEEMSPHLNSNGTGNIGKNKYLFSELNKRIKKLGIGKVLFEAERNSLVEEELTLVFGVITSRNSETSCSDIKKYTDSFPQSFKPNEMTVFNYILDSIPKEKYTDIIYGSYSIGRYYQERNAIVLYFNPFSHKSFNSTFDIKLNEGLMRLLSDLTDWVKRLKPKKKNVKELQLKILANEFSKGAKDELRKAKTNKDKAILNINSHQTSLGNELERLISCNSIIDSLEGQLENGSMTIIKEIEKAKKLNVVKNIKISSKGLEVTYIPTTITEKNFERGGGRNFGAREMFLGSLTFFIGPGKLTVSNSTPINVGGQLYQHPHATGEGKCCFGDGAGNKKIYELKASGKISDLVMYLWYFIKTVISEQAYIKSYNVYDDRLIQGFKVKDEKGKLIKINDPARLKSGEQIKLKLKKEV